jgi:hypothetical protein
MDISADVAFAATIAPGVCAAGVLSFVCVHKALTDVVLGTAGRLAHGTGALLCWMSLFAAGFVWIALARGSIWLWPDLITAVYVASWVVAVLRWWPRLRGAREDRRRLVAARERAIQATQNTHPPTP